MSGWAGGLCRHFCSLAGALPRRISEVSHDPPVLLTHAQKQSNPVPGRHWALYSQRSTTKHFGIAPVTCRMRYCQKVVRATETEFMPGPTTQKEALARYGQFRFAEPNVRVARVMSTREYAVGDAAPDD